MCIPDMATFQNIARAQAALLAQLPGIKGLVSIDLSRQGLEGEHAGAAGTAADASELVTQQDQAAGLADAGARTQQAHRVLRPAADRCV
jgi:hypothetical protein